MESSKKWREGESEREGDGEVEGERLWQRRSSEGLPPLGLDASQTALEGRREAVGELNPMPTWPRASQSTPKQTARTSMEEQRGLPPSSSKCYTQRVCKGAPGMIISILKPSFAFNPQGQ